MTKNDISVFSLLVENSERISKSWLFTNVIFYQEQTIKMWLKVNENGNYTFYGEQYFIGTQYGWVVYPVTELTVVGHLQWVDIGGGSDLTTSIGARGGRNQKDSLIKAIDINSPQWRQYKQALQILAAAEMAEVGAFISSAGGIALLAGGPMVAVAAGPVILGGVVLVGGGVIIFLDAIGYEKPLTTIQSWVRK